MEPILKKWYESLEKGKILGLKCKHCGTVMFPPVPVCRECSGMETDWVEMSGKGTLFSLGYSPSGIPGYTEEPVVIGYATLDEGMIFNATLKDVRKKDIDKLSEQLPLPVTLDIQKMNEVISFPCLCLEDK